MPAHHEPFNVLAPVDWEQVPQGDLKPFFHEIFDEAQTVIDSVPTIPPDTDFAAPRKTPGSSSSPSNQSGDDVKPPRQPTASASEQKEKLRKEWKEVKVNQKENPMDVHVFKLAAKDGKGAWFARRSLHKGLNFDDWKTGLEKEFAETMKVTGSPGSGNIRGIGADKRVEHHVVDGVGQLEVFQLSAQFPGPTSPRDFITLLLTSDFPYQAEDDASPLRQYMVVSKPCQHDECPPRSGIIRGQYESVEIIREVVTEDASSPYAVASARDKQNGAGETNSSQTAVEWIMVTRSDPGGSVPRFMIERGTPPGIVGDAGKFVKWLSSCGKEESTGPDASVTADQPKSGSQDNTGSVSEKTATRDAGLQQDPAPTGIQIDNSDNDDTQYASGLYSIITGALGTASSLASGLKKQFTSLDDQDEDQADGASKDQESDHEDDTTESDTSSIRSFASALDKKRSEDLLQTQGPRSATPSSDSRSQHNPQEKELRKLEDKRRRLDEKVVKMQERMEQKRQGDKEKDAAALAKAREKHEKELAKQEAKYRRELKRLEDRREHEIRKSEERKRKNVEKEEKTSLAMELDKMKTERDIALQKVRVLEGQLGELQAENHSLAAKLGRLSLVDDGGRATKSTEELRRSVDKDASSLGVS